jgi:hypothetical protein
MSLSQIKKEVEEKEIVIQGVAIPYSTEDALNYYHKFLIYALDNYLHPFSQVYSPAAYFNSFLSKKYNDGSERNEEADRIAKTFPFIRWITENHELWKICIKNKNE